MHLAHDPATLWTFADLEALPESPWRYEIIDGSLLVTPGPGRRHEVVSAGLLRTLQRAVGPNWFVLGPQNLDLHPSYLIPDLIVISVEKAKRDAVLTRPDEVPLVVEIVSPSSRTTDRVTKPAKYAAAGIPAYWRVEIDPAVSLTAYELRRHDEVYTEAGTWSEGETAELHIPFDIRLPIDHLLP